MLVDGNSVSELLRKESRTLLEAVLDKGIGGRAGRELLFEFFAALPIGIIVTVASENIDESIIQYANPSVLKLVGRNIEEVKGKTREVFLGPNWREHVDFAEFRRQIKESGYAQTTIDFIDARSRPVSVILCTTILTLNVPMQSALRISFVMPNR